MDTLSTIKNVYDIGSEMFGDYQRGKQMRLGSYKGVDNVKQIGQCNKCGKKLGIYHG